MVRELKLTCESRAGLYTFIEIERRRKEKILYTLGRPSIRRAILLACFIAAVFGRQPARAHFVQLIDTDTSIASNRVLLSVVDPEEAKTHTWKSGTYTAISSLTNTDGVVTWLDEDSGWARVHVAAYDPGDRKWHTWDGKNSTLIANLTVSGGVVSFSDGFWGGVIALAYDPGERAWKEWNSPLYTDATSLANTNGVVSFLAGSSRYMYAAAYDLAAHKWRQTVQGPYNSLASLTNESGVVSLLVQGHTVALAFDPTDQKWHTWANSSGVDSSLAHTGAIVAFIRGTTVYALAYDADDHKWHTWNNNTNATISNLSIADGFVYYTYGGNEYSHFMARKPKASFVATRTSRGDSMYVGFSDNSFGDITAWQWNFADARSSANQSPYHVYTKIGNYTVTLTVTGPGGANTANRDVSVTTPTYTLVYSAGANGTIYGTKSQSVKRGANGTAVTAAPNTGYHLVSWSDGSMSNPRIDTAVTANLSVTAGFAINVYGVTFATDGTAGSIVSGTASQQVNHGANCASVKAIAPPGWRFVKWLNNGVPYSIANPLTIKSVTSNMTLIAHFSNSSAAGNWDSYK